MSVSFSENNLRVHPDFMVVYKLIYESGDIVQAQIIRGIPTRYHFTGLSIHYSTMTYSTCNRIRNSWSVDIYSQLDNCGGAGKKPDRVYELFLSRYFVRHEKKGCDKASLQDSLNMGFNSSNLAQRSNMESDHLWLHKLESANLYSKTKFIKNQLYYKKSTLL